jgi:hypothetical protein
VDAASLRSYHPLVADRIVDELLRCDEPSVRWKVRTQLLGEAEDAPKNRRLRAEIRRSPLVQRLLGGRGPDGRLNAPVYSKWRGAHWVLAALADIGYPPGDASLTPLRDQVLATWLRDVYFREYEAVDKAATYRRQDVPVMQGRHRRCASQHGNALRYLTALDLVDHRTEVLAERLLHWQWPDGGWNCDRNPEAATSSFYETLLPMRGLAAHARATGDTKAGRAAVHAAEVFLSRRMAFRRSNGRLMRHDFTVLHYPLYWHYDVLGGLIGMVDVGVITDERCAKALDVLEEKRLRDGGWPAEKSYRAAASQIARGTDPVDWGGTSTSRMNPWVTTDALVVLRKAGRVLI